MMGSPRRLLHAFRSLYQRPHPAPIFLLGHPKSGTTAIASLLSRLTGLPATLDLFRVIGPPRETVEQLFRSDLPLEAFVRAHAWAFARPLLKCPKLTFLEADLRRCFPAARFVLIVRDPRDTIRSFLHRRGLTGQDTRLDGLDFLPHLTAPSAIERLGLRWTLTVEPWMRAPESFTLIRYEDFAKDREGAVRSLAATLGLEPRRGLEGHLERAYKPVSGPYDRQEFYGAANLRRLETVCAAPMERLGYARA